MVDQVKTTIYFKVNNEKLMLVRKKIRNFILFKGNKHERCDVF